MFHSNTNLKFKGHSYIKIFHDIVANKYYVVYFNLPNIHFKTELKYLDYASLRNLFHCTIFMKYKTYKTHLINHSVPTN